MIKKLFVLAIVTFSVFIVTANVFADCNGQLYVDCSNGSFNNIILDDHIYSGTDYNAHPLYMGGNLYIDRFKIDVDYLKGNVNDPIHTDVNSSLFSVGYAVTGFLANRLYIMAGYGSYSVNSDIGNKQEASGFLLGLDSISPFQQSYLDFSIYFPVSRSEYKVNDVKNSTDVDLYRLNLKYTYMLTQQLGISFGYRHDGFILGDSNNNTSVGTSSYALGIAYWFL